MLTDSESMAGGRPALSEKWKGPGTRHSHERRWSPTLPKTREGWAPAGVLFFGAGGWGMFQFHEHGVKAFVSDVFGKVRAGWGEEGLSGLTRHVLRLAVGGVHASIAVSEI